MGLVVFAMGGPGSFVSEGPRGPCASYGTFYVMIDDKCVNGPDGRVCSNNFGDDGKQARFFDGRCSPSFVPERIPYEFSNEYVNARIVSCSNISEKDIVCMPQNITECPESLNNNYAWEWGSMYDLCFRMKISSLNQDIPYCDRAFPEDRICDPSNNRYLCPTSSEEEGWSYNNIDQFCYKWIPKNRN